MKRDLPRYVYATRSKGRNYYRFRRGGVSQMVKKYAGEVRQHAAAKRARKKRDGG